MKFEDRIADVLAYDPDTGEFTWKKTIHSHALKGQRAGSMPKRGGLRIQFEGRALQATRLAFLLHLGRWPTGVVLFKDKNASNMRFSNLIETSRSTQMRRQDKPHKRTKSGLIGAHFHKKSGKYAATINWKGVKPSHIGLYDTPEEASAAYWERRKQLEQEQQQ